MALKATEEHKRRKSPCLMPFVLSVGRAIANGYSATNVSRGVLPVVLDNYKRTTNGVR
jgi:hypothetical protein